MYALELMCRFDFTSASILVIQRPSKYLRYCVSFCPFLSSCTTTFSTNVRYSDILTILKLQIILLCENAEDDMIKQYHREKKRDKFFFLREKGEISCNNITICSRTFLDCFDHIVQYLLRQVCSTNRVTYIVNQALP